MFYLLILISMLSPRQLKILNVVVGITVHIYFIETIIASTKKNINNFYQSLHQ